MEFRDLLCGTLLLDCTKTEMLMLTISLRLFSNFSGKMKFRQGELREFRNVFTYPGAYYQHYKAKEKDMLCYNLPT